MAGKGGGAWKVAYADFVTAMMAFFLVMWICSQDQKFRQAVARYFNNPMGFESFGTSKKPDKMGSMFDSPHHGDIPKGESVAMGHGRHSHTPGGEPSRATKIVSDWISEDKRLREYWHDQAKQLLDNIATKEIGQPKAKKKDQSLEKAADKLAKQMREEFMQGLPKELKGIYQDLLFRSVAEVNWRELAEDLLIDP